MDVIAIYSLISFFAMCQCELIRLTCNDIRKLVNQHNNKRNQLAKGNVTNLPPASDMQYMVWDSELAAKAENWAARGVYKHNPDKTIPSGRFPCGENIYTATGKKLQTKLEDTTNAWYDEVADYTFGPLKVSDFDVRSPKIGHFTQMIWASTCFIGCGLSRTVENGVITILFVCNYGPGGNIIDMAPYEPGQTASAGLLCYLANCSQPYSPTC